jgi:hypothetical protein
LINHAQDIGEEKMQQLLRKEFFTKEFQMLLHFALVCGAVSARFKTIYGGNLESELKCDTPRIAINWYITRYARKR